MNNEVKKWLTSDNEQKFLGKKMNTDLLYSIMFRQKLICFLL